MREISRNAARDMGNLAHHLKEKVVGIAQPEWMTRDAGFRTLGGHVSAVHRNRVLDAAEGGGRWGI